METRLALLAGILSSALFIFVYGIGLGFIFMFLPTLPLFVIGLQSKAFTALRGAIISALLIAVFISPSSAVIYMMLLGLPAWYFMHYAMRSRTVYDGMLRLWYPLGAAMANISACAVLLCGALSIYYGSAPTGLQGLLAQHITEGIKNFDDEYSQAMMTLARDWTFLIFPVSVWLWAISLYGHAWLANRWLTRQGRATRPNMAMTPFAMPLWVLQLLCICAMASLIGSPKMRFFGESSLIVMLLPYFFLGTALMHQYSLTWPSRRFFLFFIYFSIFTQVWPALALAGVGLWFQLKTLNKRLPTGGSSSKN